MTRYHYAEQNNPAIWQAVETQLPIRRRSSIRCVPGLAAFSVDGSSVPTLATNAVTQATDKSTGVTLNKLYGAITMNAAALNFGTEATFVVTNTLCAVGDVPVVCHSSGGTAGSYQVTVSAVGAGSFTITVSNVTTATNLSEAIVISFILVKASTILNGILPATPAGAGSPNSVEAADGVYTGLLTGANLNDSCVILTAFNHTRREREPDISLRVKTHSSGNTVVRFWAGLFSADPSALSTLSSLSAAAFGYDSVVDITSATDDSLFWRFKTGSGSAQQTTLTTVPVADSTAYIFRIVCNTALGVVSGYINGVLVASHSTSIPAASTLLGYGVTVTALSAASRRILVDRAELSTL